MDPRNLIPFIVQGTIQRSDAFVYQVLLVQSATTFHLAEWLNCSQRTIERSLARLSKAGLVKKDNLSGTWSSVSLASNMSISDQSINQSDQSLRSLRTDEPIDTNSSAEDISGKDDLYENDNVASVTISLARTVADKLCSPGDAAVIYSSLSKMPGTTEEIILRSVDITIQQIVNRKPGYIPIGKPVPYFLKVVYNELRQSRCVKKIKEANKNTCTVQVFSSPVSHAGVLSTAKPFVPVRDPGLPPERVAEYIAAAKSMLNKKDEDKIYNAFRESHQYPTAAGCR